jgi:hypothetical protein
LGDNYLDSTKARAENGDDDPSWWDEESCLMAIDLGYDEGGDNRDQLLVSVQIGVSEQAKKMKKSWRKRLPEKLPYFHAVDFGNYTGGVFSKANLARNERDRLLADLCMLIHQRLIGGITVRVKISEYEKLTTQVFRSQHGTSYGFAIDMCLLGAYAMVTAEGMKPEFNILIENGHRNANQVAQILARIQNFPDHLWEYYKDEMIIDLKILTAGLGSKKDHPILQSADMLAYSEWQRISQGDATIWDALLGNRSHYQALELDCDEELIREFVNEGSKPSMWRRWKKARKRYEETKGAPR